MILGFTVSASTIGEFLLEFGFSEELCAFCDRSLSNLPKFFTEGCSGLEVYFVLWKKSFEVEEGLFDRTFWSGFQGF